MNIPESEHTALHEYYLDALAELKREEFNAWRTKARQYIADNKDRRKHRDVMIRGGLQEKWISENCKGYM